MRNSRGQHRTKFDYFGDKKLAHGIGIRHLFFLIPPGYPAATPLGKILIGALTRRNVCMWSGCRQAETQCSNHTVDPPPTKQKKIQFFFLCSEMKKKILKNNTFRVFFISEQKKKRIGFFFFFFWGGGV